MTHTWILDVLADLGAYARKNDLDALAEQLDGTRRVAAAELALQAGHAGLVCIEGGAAAGPDETRRAGRAL